MSVIVNLYIPWIIMLIVYELFRNISNRAPRRPILASGSRFAL